MELNSCYACGKPIPQITFEKDGRFRLRCTRCGAKTKPMADLDEAEKDWNEGIVYTGEQYWKMVFDSMKGGKRSGCNSTDDG